MSLSAALKSFNDGLAHNGIDPATLKITAPPEQFEYLQRVYVAMINSADTSLVDGKTPVKFYDLTFYPEAIAVPPPIEEIPSPVDNGPRSPRPIPAPQPADTSKPAVSGQRAADTTTVTAVKVTSTKG